MRKKLWIGLALCVLLPGLLMTTACQKKAVQTETAAAEEDAELIKARQEAERRKQEEMRRQLEQEKLKALEEQRLREEAARRQKEAARQQFINEDIHFEFDSSALLARAQEVLRRKASYLRENPYLKVVIEGHCDERGTNEYNLALGDRRADSAKSFLVDLGISSSRLRTISYGEERPVDPRHNAEAWAKNRRAHFVVVE